jgi:hypothetical protein
VGLAADAEEALDKVMAEEIHDKIKVFWCCQEDILTQDKKK